MLMLMPKPIVIRCNEFKNKTAKLIKAWNAGRLNPRPFPLTNLRAQNNSGLHNEITMGLRHPPAL